MYFLRCRCWGQTIEIVAELGMKVVYCGEKDIRNAKSTTTSNDCPATSEVSALSHPQINVSYTCHH